MKNKYANNRLINGRNGKKESSSYCPLFLYNWRWQWISFVCNTLLLDRISLHLFLPSSHYSFVQLICTRFISFSFIVSSPSLLSPYSPSYHLYIGGDTRPLMHSSLYFYLALLHICIPVLLQNLDLCHHCLPAISVMLPCMYICISLKILNTLIGPSLILYHSHHYHLCFCHIIFPCCKEASKTREMWGCEVLLVMTKTWLTH